MKKLALFVMLMSLGMFSLGCSKAEEKPAAPTAPADAEAPADDAADAPADDAEDAPAADAADAPAADAAKPADPKPAE